MKERKEDRNDNGRKDGGGMEDEDEEDQERGLGGVGCGAEGSSAVVRLSAAVRHRSRLNFVGT